MAEKTAHKTSRGILFCRTMYFGSKTPRESHRSFVTKLTMLRRKRALLGKTIIHCESEKTRHSTHVDNFVKY